MILTTYDRYLNLIVSEKEQRKITLKRLAELTGVNSGTISRCLYQGAAMPADVMFALLIALGFSVEVTRNA